MTVVSKWEAARILRTEAENIRRRGLTNVFGLSFSCLTAQALRKDKCEGCLLGDYVREAYQQEAFPCQHIDEEAWGQIAGNADLTERIAGRLLNIADELENNARAEEPSSR